jgi:hypothetical protein
VIPPRDPGRYRRQQRRRAFVGWGAAVAAIVLVGLAAVLSGNEQQHRRAFAVPYGETMTAAEYDAIAEGEDEAEVLERLGKSGRPESLTENYVLVLFSPPSAAVVCSYWEFSDELEIFARLCFQRSDGELVQKLARDVHEGLEEGPGATLSPT